MYNFDEYINRRVQHSRKWTNWSAVGLDVSEDIIPLWIADMDFKCEPRILEELHKTVDFGILGYDAPFTGYFEPFLAWQKKKNNWQLDQKWFSSISGVVPGIAHSVLSLTEKNDKILIQPPVYPPFFRVVAMNERILVENTLRKGTTGYEIDFADLEKKLQDCKMMILCNPHNPVGRVYTKEELQKIGTLCLKHNVILVSDEIHSDLILKGHKHIPIASLSEELSMNTITLCAPSKTFNIAGLAQSVAVIPNPELKKAFDRSVSASAAATMSSFGLSGFYAAYKYGEQWLNEALDYIEANIDYTLEYLNQHIPQIKVFKPEGTFLLWLDLNEISTDTDQLDTLLIEKAKILLNKGTTFGNAGSGFYRLNIASPRSVLEEALNRLHTAVNG